MYITFYVIEAFVCFSKTLSENIFCFFASVFSTKIHLVQICLLRFCHNSLCASGGLSDIIPKVVISAEPYYSIIDYDKERDEDKQQDNECEYIIKADDDRKTLVWITRYLWVDYLQIPAMIDLKWYNSMIDAIKSRWVHTVLPYCNLTLLCM